MFVDRTVFCLLPEAGATALGETLGALAVTVATLLPAELVEPLACSPRGIATTIP